MKKFALLFLFCSQFSGSQVTDFLTGLNQPNRLIIDDIGTIYIKGTASPGEIIYMRAYSPFYQNGVLFNSLPDSSEPLAIGSIALQGDIMYLSYFNDNTGESTLASFDVNNPTVLNDIVSGLGYVAALDIFNNELYFTDEDLTGGGTSLKKIDITTSNPVVNEVLTGLTNPQDMEFNGSTLYIGDRDANTIYSIDVSLQSPSLNPFISGVQVRGVYVYNDFLLFSDSNTIKSAPFNNPTNITIEAEDNDATPEILRDVVIYSCCGMFMVQEESGKLVYKYNNSLSIDQLDGLGKDISFYVANNKLVINGLNPNNSKIRIHDLNGKRLFAGVVNANHNSIDLSTLASGIYLLNIEGIKTYKFVK